MSIAEDVWKLLSDAVYDKPPYENKAVLLEKINNVIAYINQSKRNVIQTLYENMRSRLCKVLLRKGEIINKPQFFYSLCSCQNICHFLHC